MTEEVQVKPQGKPFSRFSTGRRCTPAVRAVLIVLAVIFAAATALYSFSWMYYIRHPPRVEFGINKTILLPDNTLQITSLYPNGPAQQAGLKIGDRILAISPEVRASAHEDGLALLHIQTGRVFLCNRTGSRIWQSVADGLSLDAISEQISRECGVTRDLVVQHTAEFLFELERRGLVYQKVGS